MREDQKPRHGPRTQAAETDDLLHSAIDMDQVIVVEAELLEDSLDHGGRFGPQLNKIKDRALRNADLLEILHERLGIPST